MYIMLITIPRVQQDTRISCHDVNVHMHLMYMCIQRTDASHNKKAHTYDTHTHTHTDTHTYICTSCSICIIYRHVCTQKKHSCIYT